MRDGKQDTEKRERGRTGSELMIDMHMSKGHTHTCHRQ